MTFYRKQELEKKIAKVEYQEVFELRNRLSVDGSGETYEEDHLLLDRVLDLLELIMLDKDRSYFIDELEQQYLEKE